MSIKHCSTYDTWDRTTRIHVYDHVYDHTYRRGSISVSLSILNLQLIPVERLCHYKGCVHTVSNNRYSKALSCVVILIMTVLAVARTVARTVGPEKRYMVKSDIYFDFRTGMLVRPSMNKSRITLNVQMKKRL
jgi:hypothetical protein